MRIVLQDLEGEIVFHDPVLSHDFCCEVSRARTVHGVPEEKFDT